MSFVIELNANRLELTLLMWRARVRDFLFNWQTLISGVLAVLVGGLTAIFLAIQIWVERRRHTDSVYRKSLAARAQMPDALDEIVRYVEGCILWYDRNSTQPPQRPKSAIDALKATIEYLDNSTALTLFDLISKYQIHNARLASVSPPVRAPEDADRLYDSALLYALASRLFPYARNEQNTAPQGAPTAAEMMTALKIVTGPAYPTNYQVRWQKVTDIIARRHK